MKDKLERFVRDNREAFDDHEPSNDLWAKIAKNTTTTKPKSKVLVLKEWFGNSQKFVLGMAAGFAIFLLISYLAYNYVKPTSQDSEIMAMSPTYGKELTQFATLIETKREELKVLALENPELYHQFDTELTVLDQNYQHLRKELPKNPNQEELLKAMVQNLTFQIEMLNQQLAIIQKIKDVKNEKPQTII